MDELKSAEWIQENWAAITSLEWTLARRPAPVQALVHRAVLAVNWQDFDPAFGRPLVERVQQPVELEVGEFAHVAKRTRKLQLALARTGEAADEHGLKVISEVMDRAQVEKMVDFVDIFQVGARNMQNFTLLRELGRVTKPVLLKRGISATIEEWLLSAEYILGGGNPDVVLCERGIRTFETSTRNTLDVCAIPVVKKLSHLPIIADPSHATGRRDKVAPMARASVAAGADGLLIEVHSDPDHALSDGPQSLFPAQFDRLMAELRIIAPAIGRGICVEAPARRGWAV